MDAEQLLITRLRDALDCEGRVRFAYLFGSATLGAQRGARDLDLAVWLVDGSAAREWAYRSLLPDLMVAARSDAVDLTILNDAPPALRFAVQKTGVAILESSAGGRAARLAFEQRARKDFWDFRPRLERYAQCLRERLERGAFGT